MGKINVLSFEVANLIAAGEVVDRPASCIKELVENSIDSGAGRITVEIQNGGILYMRVTDNGCGMEPEDLATAVRRHATSKIKDATDLAAIMTLGFRGEALAAICAVSDVRIVTRTANAEYGAQIEVNSGRAGKVTERGASVGTTVIVENLFANVPARLKFLKRDQTEAMAVCAAVEKIAMSHPEIAFRLISDGNVKLETPGDGKLASAVKAVYGKDFASKILPVDCTAQGVRAWGYITSPESPRANRNYQNFFINGRYIKTRTGSAAIEQAYTSYIPPEKFPGCILNLEISPAAVDVNVHPSKLEVKFSNEKPVFDAVYRAVRDALLTNTSRPTLGKAEEPPVSAAFAPVNDRADGKESAPKQLSITDVCTSTDTVKTGTPDAAVKNVASASAVTSSGITVNLGTPSVSPAKAPVTATESKGTNTQPEREKVPYLALQPEYAPSNPAFGGQNENAGREERENVASDAENPAVQTEAPEAADSASGDIASVSESAPRELVLSKSPTNFSRRTVGELFNSYVIVEEGDTVTIIDKHAAHERIIFEKLRRNMKSLQRATQLLALTVDITMSAEEAAAIEQNRESIEGCGFGFTVERNTVKVSEIPADISADAVGSMFETFAAVITGGTGNVALAQETVFEKALYQASCKAAIKAGRVYPEGYINWLVEEMARVPEATYCPHGRPVAFTYKKSDFDRMFKRT